MHEICIERALSALGYSYAVNGQVKKQKQDRTGGRLAYENNIQLSILLRNRSRPASLIVDVRLKISWDM